MPRYSAEVKAAVMAMLLAGGTPAQAAKEHGVSVSCIKNWRKECPELPLKQPDIGDLVEGLLRSELRCLNSIADWAEEEPARIGARGSEIAVFYGVMSDKAHAKLAALSFAQREYQQQLLEQGIGEAGSVLPADSSVEEGGC